MQLEELEEYKRIYPDLGELISQLETYYISLSEKKENPVIVPILVAKKLSVSEELANILLLLSDKAGLINPRYQIYCKESDSNIAEFQTLKDIPPAIFCPYHDTDHEADDYEIDLVFRFSQLFRDKYQKSATTA